MRILFFILLLLLSSSVSYANTFADLKFSREQVADTQWDMSTCGVVATCNLSNIIPFKNPLKALAFNKLK